MLARHVVDSRIQYVDVDAARRASHPAALAMYALSDRDGCGRPAGDTDADGRQAGTPGGAG